MSPRCWSSMRLSPARSRPQVPKAVCSLLLSISERKVFDGLALGGDLSHCFDTEVEVDVGPITGHGSIALLGLHSLRGDRRICFLDDGVILEKSAPQDLFSNPQQPRTRQFLQRITDAGRL